MLPVFINQDTTLGYIYIICVVLHCNMIQENNM